MERYYAGSAVRFPQDAKDDMNMRTLKRDSSFAVLYVPYLLDFDSRP